MNLSNRTFVKRLIAALCVALIAFIAIEFTSPAHIMEDLAREQSYNVAVASVVHADGGDKHAPQKPQHHCCSAHTAGLPVIAPAGAMIAVAQVVTPPVIPLGAESARPSALDRPPRASANS